MFYPYMMGDFGFLSSMLHILAWVLFAIFIIWIIKASRGHMPDRRHGHGGALDIARERYAKGEITRDEFEQMKKDLA